MNPRFTNIPQLPEVYTNVQSNSANWDSAYTTATTYQSESGSYASTQYVNSNFLALSGGLVSGPVRINNNLTVFGNLTASGTTTFANTVFSVTSALSVIHVGSGPAMFIGNNGDGDIASFYDIDQNLEVLHVGGQNGSFPNVGVKISTPNKDFTVNGEISANNTIYDATGNSNQWNQAFNISTAYQTTSGQFALSAHASTHHTGGTDAIAPSSIGAQSLFTTTTNSITGNTTIPAGRALIYQVVVTSFTPVTANINLPSSGHQAGDVIVVRSTTPFTLGSTLTIRDGVGNPVDTITTSNQAYRYTANDTGPNAWNKILVDTHTHAATDITSGIFNTARIPNLNQLYLPLSGGTITGNISSTNFIYARTTELNDNNISSPTLFSLKNWSNSTTGNRTEYFKSRSGIINVLSAVQTGDILGQFSFLGVDKNNSQSPSFAASIQATVDDSPDLGIPGALTFSTGTSSIFSNTPRMTIKSSGNVGINTTTPNERLTVIGNISATGNISTQGQFLSAGVDIGTLFGTGGGDGTADTDVRALTGNWQSTYTTVQSNSASWVNSKTIAQFTAIDNQPLSANFATLDTRISIAVLDFDDTTTESACFVGVIPEGTNLASGLQARLHWAASTATTGNVDWGVQFMNLNTPLSADSFDTAAFGITTTSSMLGMPSTTTITCTALNGMTAGSFYRMRVFRDSADTVNDTMGGDAELIAVEVRSAA